MRVLFLPIFLSLVLLTACSGTSSKRSIGEVIDDAVITNKLKVRYMKDKTVKAHRIDVDTWKGVVSLRGRLEAQEQINRAIELAERQPGVREVKSFLVLGEPGSAPEPRSRRRKQPEIEETDLKPEKNTRSQEEGNATGPGETDPEETGAPPEVIQD